MADSLNLTCSPIVNLLAFRYTKLIVVEVLSTIWPTALLSCPVIFSPITAFVSKFNPETNVNLSNIGLAVFLDSYTAITLLTSGTLSDISWSSTLVPYPRLLFNPASVVKLPLVEIPTVLATSNCWLLT